MEIFPDKKKKRNDTRSTMNPRKIKCKNVKSTTLTERELDVLKWIAEGKTTWEIAIILGVSQSTINFHILNTKEKLNVTNRVQAIVKAIYLGLLELE